MAGYEHMLYRVFRFPSKIGSMTASFFKAIISLRALFKGGGLDIHTQAEITSRAGAKEDMPLSARTLLQADGDLVTFIAEEKSKDPEFIQSHYEAVAARIKALDGMLTAILFLPLGLTAFAVMGHYLWPLLSQPWNGFSELWEKLFFRLKGFGLYYLAVTVGGHLIGILLRPLAVRGLIHFYKMKFPASSLPERSDEPMKLF